jgi:integrase
VALGIARAGSWTKRLRYFLEAFKSKRPHVVILNDVAWSIIQAQRDQHPIWVFPYRDTHVATMNNTAWQRARRDVGLGRVRIHDLRHVWATWHVMAGTPIAELQELGAWKSELMVRRYAHSPEKLRYCCEQAGHIFGHTWLRGERGSEHNID